MAQDSKDAHLDVDPTNKDRLVLNLNGSGLEPDVVVAALKGANLRWIVKIEKKRGRPGKVLLITTQRRPRSYGFVIGRLLEALEAQPATAAKSAPAKKAAARKAPAAKTAAKQTVPKRPATKATAKKAAAKAPATKSAAKKTAAKASPTKRTAKATPPPSATHRTTNVRTRSGDVVEVPVTLRIPETTLRRLLK